MKVKKWSVLQREEVATASVSVDGWTIIHQDPDAFQALLRSLMKIYRTIYEVPTVEASCWICGEKVRVELTINKGLVGKMQFADAEVEGGVSMLAALVSAFQLAANKIENKIESKKSSGVAR